MGSFGNKRRKFSPHRPEKQAETFSDQFPLDFSMLGNGFRNVYYSTIKDEKLGKVGEITLFGYDKDANPTTFKFPYRVSVAYNIKGDTGDTGEVDLYGETLRRKWFNTTYERRQWLKAMEESKSIRIIEAFPPEDNFIMDAFRHRIYDEDYNDLPLRVFFYDIECAVENKFPYPEETPDPINIITILDSIDNRYYSWALSDRKCENTLGTYGGMPITLFKFGNEKRRVDLDYKLAKNEITEDQFDHDVKVSLLEDEKKMLKHFVTWVSGHQPDVWSGWNSRMFDMPYIIKRIEKVLGKKWAEQMCPGGYYREKKLIFEEEEGDSKKMDRNNTVILMSGVSQMDLKVLYKDKFKIRQALDGGYNLNNVSLVELDDEKVKHEEGFNNFWKVNFQRYWEYNVQDVSLVYRIEEKLGLITQARSITSIGSTNMDSIYQSINYIMQSLAMFSTQKFSKTWLTASVGGKKKGEKYTGAFVFDVQAGVYRYGEGTVDFNSLYPNTGRSLNLSPETKMAVVFGDWDDPNDHLYIVPNDLVWKVSPEMKQKLLTAQSLGKPGIELSRKALDKILTEMCCNSVKIVRKSDGVIYHVLFKKYEHQKGIFSEWLGFYFDKRKALKKVLKEWEDKADAVEGRYREEIAATDEGRKMSEKELKKAVAAKAKADDDYRHFVNMADRYDHLQQATKILINSAYGTLGTPSSPIYDVELAETITLNGQFTNKSAAKKIAQIYRERYGASDDFVPQLSGDTDSITGKMRIEAFFSEELKKKLEQSNRGTIKCST